MFDYVHSSRDCLQWTWHWPSQAHFALKTLARNSPPLTGLEEHVQPRSDSLGPTYICIQRVPRGEQRQLVRKRLRKLLMDLLKENEMGRSPEKKVGRKRDAVKMSRTGFFGFFVIASRRTSRMRLTGYLGPSGIIVLCISKAFGNAWNDTRCASTGIFFEWYKLVEKGPGTSISSSWGGCRAPQIYHFLPTVKELYFQDIVIGVFLRMTLAYHLEELLSSNWRKSVEDMLHMIIQVLGVCPQVRSPGSMLSPRICLFKS